MADPYRAPVLVDADPLPNTCVPGGATPEARCPASAQRPLTVELRALPPGLSKAFTASATLLLLVASASLSAITWTVAHASAVRDAHLSEQRAMVQQVQQSDPVQLPGWRTHVDRPALLAALGAGTHDPDQLWARASRLVAAGFDLTTRREQVSRDEVTGALEHGDHARIAHEDRDDGGPGGLRVLEIAPGSVLARTGLRPRDLITAVNGYALARPGDVMRAYDRLAERSGMVVELMREGRPVALRIDWQ